MKRRRKSLPNMLIQFSRQDQRRFIESVERFQSLVNDLAVILAPKKRKRLLESVPNEKKGEAIV